MSYKLNKFIAKVPIEFQIDGIQWLVIEPQVDNGKIVGYYLFGHEDLSIPSLWDAWFQTIEDAYEAGTQYGVEASDWISNLVE